MEETKKKKGFSIYWLFGKIGDIIFIPIIIIALMSSIFMLSSNKKNKPISFFGYSLVNILSGSMRNSGFKVGDSVFTHTTDVNHIKLGDIIAFYNYRDRLDLETTKKTVVKFYYEDGNLICDMSEENKIYGEYYGTDLKSIPKIPREGEKSVEDAYASQVGVFFHQVIGIYLDDYGNVFFRTKGTSNKVSDQLIRSDFVVGKYVNTPRWVRNVISFCSSTRGMIMIVCFPLSILVLMECFSLIEQFEILSYEKEIVKGKVKLYEDQIKEKYDPNDMEIYNKAYLYYFTPDEHKDEVEKLIWSKLKQGGKLSKKEKKEYETKDKAKELLKESKDEYWQTWLNFTKGYDRKKLLKYYKELALNKGL